MGSAEDWSPNFGELNATPPERPAGRRRVRIAVMGDFSGRSATGRLEIGDELGARRGIDVDFDKFEDVMARLEPRLLLPIGEDGATVELSIANIDDFHPDQLYRSLEVFSALSGLRQRLNNASTFAKAAAEVAGWGGTGAKPARRRKQRSRGASPAPGARLDEFARLMGRLRLSEPTAKVDALVREAVAPFVVPAPDPKKDALVASVDSALSGTMRKVLHQPEFQTMEAMWRGLEFLIQRVETGAQLQVLLYDVSAEELAADLGSTDDLAETGLYRMLVEAPAGERDGALSLICGCYLFEPTPPHVELLGRMARIAAHAGAPFVASIAPDEFAQRGRAMHPLFRQAWKALRELDAATHLALAAPRFMLRHPYGRRSDPIGVFDFEEFTSQEGLGGMLWGNPALLAAAVLAAPGGSATPVVGDLPFHFFTDSHGDQIALPCTERVFSTDATAQLVRDGIMAVHGMRGRNEVRLAGVQSVNGTELSLAGGPAPGARARVSTSVGFKSSLKPVEKPKPVKPAADDDGDSMDEFSFDSDDSSDLSSDDSSDFSLDGFGGDDSSSGDEAASEESSELDALLSSWGDDTDSSGDTDDAGGGDDDSGDMDPDLEALLKGL